MRKTNNSPLSREKEIFKKTGFWYKEDALIKPKTVFIISAIACITDGLTVYLTLDPLLKTMVLMTLLCTFTASAILDVFPAFWPYAFDRMKGNGKENKTFFQKLIKILFIISLITWFFVFAALCIVRCSAWEFILLDTIRESLIAQQDTDLYQPQFTAFLGQMLMLFMNAVNIATSASVLLASMLSYVPNHVKMKAKRNTINLLLTEAKIDREQEINQLNAVIENDEYRSVEDAKHNSAYNEAAAEALTKSVEAREDLESYLNDPDVDVTVTASSEELVN